LIVSLDESFSISSMCFFKSSLTSAFSDAGFEIDRPRQFHLRTMEPAPLSVREIILPFHHTGFSVLPVWRSNS